MEKLDKEVEEIVRGIEASDREHELYNPEVNPDAISLVKQPDGNWMGYAQRFGKLVVVREVKPEDCLLKLITHG